jgi:phosphoglycolate phosphatase-like HAD superfamily hydrolase
MKRRVVFVDVDDTLVRSVGNKRIPIPAVIKAVKRLHEEGAELFLWSSGGADYCRKAAAERGVAECFTGFVPKPTVYIDDQALLEWRDCQHFYPMQAAEV